MLSFSVSTAFNVSTVSYWWSYSKVLLLDVLLTGSHAVSFKQLRLRPTFIPPRQY